MSNVTLAKMFAAGLLLWGLYGIVGSFIIGRASHDFVASLLISLGHIAAGVAIGIWVHMRNR